MENLINKFNTYEKCIEFRSQLVNENHDQETQECVVNSVQECKKITDWVLIVNIASCRLRRYKQYEQILY